jgi:hypothetical protein
MPGYSKTTDIRDECASYWQVSVRNSRLKVGERNGWRRWNEHRRRTRHASGADDNPGEYADHDVRVVPTMEHALTMSHHVV